MYDSTYKALSKIGKFIKMKSRIEVTRGKGGGIESYCLMVTWCDEKDLEKDSDGCTTL